MKYYTNKIHEKRFSEDDIIPEGGIPGRLNPVTTTKNCFFINNGEEEKFINSTEAIPAGGNKGRLFHKHIKHRKQGFGFTNGVDQKQFYNINDVPDGGIKGRLPLSEEQKIKCSKSHLGLHQSEETKQKISEHSNNNREKAFNTIKEKYGSLHNFFQQISQKGIVTKLKKGTINTSEAEKLLLKELRKIYGYEDVLTQYKCDRYQFRCDFYIRSKDLFIELNAHGTHGDKPYDPNDLECQKKLEIGQEKAKTSKFYANAIKTGTIRDVQKREAANKNNLNYLAIY